MEVSQSFVDAEIASTVGKEQSVLCDSRGQFSCSEIVVVDIYQGAQAKAFLSDPRPPEVDLVAFLGSGLTKISGALPL